MSTFVYFVIHQDTCESAMVDKPCTFVYIFWEMIKFNKVNRALKRVNVR